MKNFNSIIDYSLVKNFDEQLLHEKVFIPISSDSIYLNCYIYEYSNIDDLSLNKIVKTYSLDKTDILFLLSDLEFRVYIFELSKKVINSKENTIEEFFIKLISKAISLRVSDIHIETQEMKLQIRFRIDGVLKTFYMFDKELHQILSSYLKSISKLDITQNRVPQDGRFSISVSSKNYDCRLSTMPTIYGESLVIRVLDNNIVFTDLKKLGFSKSIYDEVKSINSLVQGLVLITGPTGSGKSTTLYSLLNSFDSSSKKIITIEDPVEYKLEHIQQIEINEEIGLGFDTVLRNILRQDPDIILIGEIRDDKSLSIALQAALTGHLVLASIHANNSVETLSRLIDLKADFYMLASSLKYIISQRLVLKTCKDCDNEGCLVCNYTGFLGRICLAEILSVDEKIASFILDGFKLNEIKELLKQRSFKTILDNGKEKVINKETTLSEVYKVVNI